jgi:ABC-type nickel/cobalt efflux system permease component RcnA
MGLLAIVAVGFLLGMRHATDPDHVIAVSTIVTREGELKRAALIGVAWGIGHTLTILVVGSVMILFRIALPPRLGLAMELVVGLMLIVLGLRNLRALFPWSARPAPTTASPADVVRPNYHVHGDYVHAHGRAHAHDPQHTPVAVMDRWFSRSGLYHWVRPVIIGIVHGLAGSAAIALLILSTITSTRWAVAYLAVFGMGTVLGMMLITVTLGTTLAYGQKRFTLMGNHFGVAAGIISVAFGLFIAYQTGFVDGLFTGNVRWTPR